ncbi:MAG: long-chain fatty acid--CoA ligase, partial [Thermoanaerobaculum sp.]|nr:long-chain fatty acid--CoA ligase [Thermoanaerobaculum sp.]MDW7967526.1 long-chain fatty acid--CoA ligase [Thermoanaerobaculum sp.]
EWHVVDFALQHLGAVNVPIYTTLLPPQMAHILRDSGAKACVVEHPELLTKVLEAKASCPELRHLIVMDGTPPPAVLRWGEVVETVDPQRAIAALEEMASRVQPQDLATIIYTSGTTGEPKGAMLTHDNFVFDALAAASVQDWPPYKEVALSFLPLSHVLERLVDYILFAYGASIAYCGILEAGEALRRIRPHLFTAVPRFYEKVYDRIMTEGSHGSPIKQRIFHAAIQEALRAFRTGKKGLAYALYDALVYKKIRQAFGGRLRFSISGGAPLPVYVGEFLHALGIYVLEGYGLTETSPVISVNTTRRVKLGTVGPPIPGVEVKIAPDGEILTRGRHVMKGYWNKPEATQEAIDAEGWFHTGDVGELDEEGYLRITDRKKDILVTAGGKNIAPQPIENQLKTSPLVENAVLFGDQKPYVVALLVPNFDELTRWAQARGIPTDDREVLVQHPAVLQLYQGVVDQVNSTLARFETIKKFRLLSQPFTMDGGELTPTLKVKRRVILQRFGALVEAMYGEEVGEH